MSHSKMLVGVLSTAVLLTLVVSTAKSQPDPFQPLKPKTEEASATATVRLVEAPACVSVVAESKGDSEQRAKITAALNAETAIDFHEVPLSDVMDFVQDLHGIPIVLDLRALDDVGISSDTPVTAAFKGISLRSVMRIMLRTLDLTYVVSDGVLQITTSESAESRLLQHVYPLSDLADPNTAASTGLAQLSDLIVQAVSPSSWSEQGGSGVVVPIAHLGVLVVSQTTDVHEQIADLIETLRRVRDMQAE